ncbi:hypothetical protein VP1G_01810 [Cytospora mali]|uniref:YMC020W-like alpha/beta hydrolase domain-containing protein n=1 Tax=Cytospora mali TaxID=578113 RepID=A0A194URU1_CYTMA|nr:hypothetical protein VP1G_01810 [Valsa mali var. pyri (nom. inval.)]
MPLQPSQAKSTSALSNLSATSTPASPAQRPTTESAQGMPPPPLPQLETNNKSVKSRRSSNSIQQDGKLVHKTRSWYGSWPRKSGASTSVQRETILGSPLKTGSVPDFSRFDTKKSNGDTASLSGASQASVNALAQLQETASEMPATQNDVIASDQETPRNDTGEDTNQKKDAEHAKMDEPEDGGVAAENAPGVDAPPVVDTPQVPPTSSGWLGGWFSRPPVPEERQAEEDKTKQVSPEPPKETEPAPVAEQTQDTGGPGATQLLLSYANPQRAATWLGLWSSNTEPKDGAGETAKPEEPTPAVAEEPGENGMQDAPPANPEPASKPSAGSTWAFWSKDSPKSPDKQTEVHEQGELAVMGEGSESQPTQANSTDIGRDSIPKSEPPQDVQGKAKSTKNKPSKKKKNRPKPMELNDIPSRPDSPQSDAPSVKVDSSFKTKTTTPTTATKSGPPNLLLPSFKGTYKMKENPSIVQQIAALILRTEQKQPAKHVFLTKDPPKIKKALAIGVHGLFPATYLRAMIGQPTGTSIRFANHCAEAIRRWADSHGSEGCEIEKVALEGEGKIGDRVENLWKLLLNWIDHIRDADLIVVACHSQGVPVSVMLIAKLIELGIITNAKIGVCAMAGVNLGPFPDYKSGMGMLMGSAAELWEFANPESEVSKRYETSLKAILAYGVRITYVGSIDDQLVPIESAIYSPASHPYIYRAVFIDGRIHAPDFIAHLVGFACKLRNLGISDHGLVRELSVPLAGSLYGGEGHSRLYDDGQVYDLGIAHTLETTDVGNVPCEMQKHESLVPSNPYLLPWIMRGLLEEDFVKTELGTETEELLRQFDDWKPATKALKDVKYRLEAVRSRL